MMSALVVVGLIVTALGFALPDRLRAPWSGLAAFLAPLGLAASLLGVLLICVPHFFDEEPERTGQPSASAVTGAPASSSAENPDPPPAEASGRAQRADSTP